MARNPKVQETVDKIGRIYDLVEEMNTIVNELYGVGVRAYFGGRSSMADPLGQAAVVEFRMDTVMEPLSRHD